MPNLTVRSFAELLSLPAYQQSRILLEQKYPKKEPQVFKIPYYSESLSAIRNYYLQGNNRNVLSAAINDIQNSTKLKPKKENNIRVISSFSNGTISERNFKILTNSRYKLVLGNVTIKLNFDITVEEEKVKKYILFNFRNVSLDDETARLTLELSNYILKENGINVALKNIEFIDLYTDKIFNFKKIRKSTINKLNQNISIIEALWSTI